jgi:hypothetical protein
MEGIIRWIRLKLDPRSAKDFKNEASGALKDGTDPKAPLNNLQQIEQGFNKLKRAAVAAAGFFGLSFGAREVIKATTDSEAAFAQLANTVRVTGGAAGFTTDELVRMSQEMAKASTTSASAVQGGLQRLLAYSNIQGDSFARAAQSALDMAEALGMDMVQASETLGAALDDPINGLGRLAKQNFRFTDSEKEVIASLVEANDLFSAQALILDTIDDYYAGAAQAARDTLGGALKALNEALQDQLTLGAKSSGALADAINKIAENMRSLARIARDLGIVLGAAGLAKSANSAALAFGKLRGAAILADKTLLQYIRTTRAFQLATGPYGWFTLAISAMVIGFMRMRDAANDAAEAAREALRDIQATLRAGDQSLAQAELARIEDQLDAAQARLRTLREQGAPEGRGLLSAQLTRYQDAIRKEENLISNLSAEYRQLTDVLTASALARHREGRAQNATTTEGGAGGTRELMRWAETHKQFGIITRTSADAEREWGQSLVSNINIMRNLQPVFGQLADKRKEHNEKILQDQLESNARMLYAAQETAWNMTDAFQPFFEGMILGLTGIEKFTENLKENLAGIGAAIVESLIQGRAEEQMAAGTAALASGTWPPNPAAIKAAALHFAAAAAYRAIPGAIRAAGRGGASSGMPNMASTTLPTSQVERMGPDIKIYLDGVDPRNPRHQSLLSQTMQEYRERTGGRITVETRQWTP